MVLEIRAFASQELYEQVIPRLGLEGFVARRDLDWTDPESDGEYGGMYFEYEGEEELPVEDFARLVRELQALLDPPGHFGIASPRHARRKPY